MADKIVVNVPSHQTTIAGMQQVAAQTQNISTQIQSNSATNLSQVNYDGGDRPSYEQASAQLIKWNTELNAVQTALAKAVGENLTRFMATAAASAGRF